MDFAETIAKANREVTLIGTVNLNIEIEDYANTFLRLLEANDQLVLNILYESDNQLFMYSLCNDTQFSRKRISFTELKFKKGLVVELKDSILKGGGYLPEEKLNFLQKALKQGKELPPDIKEQYDKSRLIADRIVLLEMHLPIPLSVIRVDGLISILPCLPTTIGSVSDYQKVSEDSGWQLMICEYIDSYLHPQRAGKFSAEKEAEIIELYDQERSPRGIFPRSCFYNTDYHQYVIWDFIFDRQGHMLIHKRKSNAKDNQGMWDKSVGGHVDWSKEFGSENTAIREMIEELFEDETNKESMAYFTESEENIVFLGEWNPKKRKRLPLEEIRSLGGKEWFYFKVPEQLQINTPRYFPNEVKQLRVIVDSYIFITNKLLTLEKLRQLKNSDFRLVTLPDLKNEMERGEFLNADGMNVPFTPTPDLTTIMTGTFREMLEQVSQYVRYTFRNMRD